MWGQTLTGNEPDSYPRLTDDPAAKVYKVSFMMKNASGEGQTEEETEEYTEYSAAYTNTGGTVKLPPEPESDQYQFAGWSQSESAEGAAFTEETIVSGDRKVYAFGQEKYAGIDPEKTVTITYGEGIKLNLSEYMKYAAGTPAADKFTYKIVGGNISKSNPTENGHWLAATVAGDSLTIPDTTDADIYLLKIKAEEKDPVISLFSADYGTDAAELSITVVVKEAEATVTAPVAKTGLEYNGEPQELITEGKTSDGTILYRLGDSGEYSKNIPTATEAGTYTVWYKVEADKNHKDTEPASVTVTIAQAGSQTEVDDSSVVYGQSLTLTAKVSKVPETPVNGLLDLATENFAAAQDTVDFYLVVDGENGESRKKLGSAEVIYGETDPDSGTATLAIDTREKKLAAGENIITAEYGGSVSLNGSGSGEAIVMMTPKQVQYTVSASGKTYDATADVDVTLTPTNLESGDSVTLTAEGSVPDIAAGTYTTVDLTNITLAGEDSMYYSVPETASDVPLSSPVTITPAAETTEKIEIDYASETLTGFEPGTYLINGNEITAESESLAIRQEWFGKTLMILRKAPDENHGDSTVQKISGPARPEAPAGVTGGTGSIGGADETMEYRLSSSDEWVSVKDTEPAGLEPGTYLIRVKATETSFAGEAVSVTVRGTSGGSSGGGGGSGGAAAPSYSIETEADENGTVKTDADKAEKGDTVTVTILWRLEHAPVIDYLMNFEDVDASSWYAEAVRWAAGEGLAEGVGDGLFAPDDPITREQMATILYRYTQWKGYASSSAADLSGYDDMSQISGSLCHTGRFFRRPP